jgi:hypothetical protein
MMGHVFKVPSPCADRDGAGGRIGLAFRERNGASRPDVDVV